MNFDIHSVPLASLNSMTKYPSIPTYHALDPSNGSLIESQVTDFGQDEVIMTEKVDGTNSRIILCPDGPFLIGSREELLHAGGDVVANPSMGIVDALRDVAKSVAAGWNPNRIVVFYLETFGGKTSSGSKNYGREVTGYRLFDMCDIEYYGEVLYWSPERISSWRESGGQKFRAEGWLTNTANQLGIPVAPRILFPGELPTTLSGMSDFLSEHLPKTKCLLSPSGLGVPEGIVLRNYDRSKIAKARFEDYARTLRRIMQGGRGRG